MSSFCTRGGKSYGSFFKGGVEVPSSSAFTDDFNRADENLDASGVWLRAGMDGSAAIRSNMLAALPVTAIAGGLFLCPDQGVPDHYVEFTLKSVGDANSGSFVLCRGDTTGNNFVGIRVTPFFLTDGIEVYRRVGGTLTALHTGTNTATIDDVLRLECVGANWEIFKNGASLASGAIGATGVLITNTRQGIIARVGDQNPWIDDFEAGAIG